MDDIVRTIEKLFYVFLNIITDWIDLIELFFIATHTKLR